MPSADPRDTPAMRQHARFKQRHPDCLLWFRIGDFYELFDDDAVIASKALGLTLTQRTEGIPMCGMPYHQLDAYLRRALAQGLRVAICDQVQDAAEAKGIVERAVTRVLTPGTLVDQSLLEDERSANLAAVAFLGPARAASRGGPNGKGRHGTAGENGDSAHEPGLAALAIAELSTGAFFVTRCPAEGQALIDELARRQVTELLYAETADGKRPPRVARLIQALGLSATPQPQWHFRTAEAHEALRQQFGVKTFEGLGFRDEDPELVPAGALVRYLRATQTPEDDAGSDNRSAHPLPASKRGPRPTLAHLQPPRRELVSDRLILDAASLRALEIDRTIRSGALEGSLLGIFLGPGQKSACRTAMGKRLLREWLVRPPAVLETIAGRQRAVASLVEDRRLAGEVAEALEGVQDVPRIAARLALGRVTPRDLVGLGKSLAAGVRLAETLRHAPALAGLRGLLASVESALLPVAERVAKLCVDAPPAHLREGGLIRDGVDAALDEARGLKASAEAWLAKYQAELIARHNLPSLKVAFNKVFGFYIELPRAQAQRAPAEFSRRQTLTNAERFITPELKAFEDKVQHADARALEREQALFAELCGEAAGLLRPMRVFAEAIAELDVLRCFADKAAERRWCRPELTDAPSLSIVQGRHPVLDELLGRDFVPNDVALGPVPPSEPAAPATSPEEQNAGAAASLALITGPNMAGKSTFIRQTALLTILAHAGSCIPAERAVIGLADRVFTRVGADDALHAGQSTFMVEMIETASILHHCTARSLVVLDEIGRGTSTLDGLSLAWAIAERLAGNRDQQIEGSRDQGLDDSIPRSLGASVPSPRTLFATHYHELTRLEDLRPGRVRNLHVAVREFTAGDGQPQIVFLHRILPGRTDRSYGIHVARLAGLPEAVVRRAREVMESLSVEHAELATPTPPTPTGEHAGQHAGQHAARSDGPAQPVRMHTPPPPPTKAAGQLALFTEFVPHPAVDALRELKLETLTPMQAFDALRQLAELARHDRP
jgi:DNA mismatch repair protein MutS